MTLWCCVTPERERKTKMLMRALAEGWPDARVIRGEPPDDGQPFIVWGQKFLTERILPKAIKQERPFWHIDNGYWMPARGTIHGFYRITYRGLSPTFMPNADRSRLRIEMRPWTQRGKYVVFAHPGPTYGVAAGLDMLTWMGYMARVLAKQPRPVIVREKTLSKPLAPDLIDAHCLVTHSSNVAVDAVLAGVPVVVAPTSPAAPVGSTNFGDLENLVRPDREPWWASLMSQQFTVREMSDGTAHRLLRLVADAVDAHRRAA